MSLDSANVGRVERVTNGDIGGKGRRAIRRVSVWYYRPLGCQKLEPCWCVDFIHCTVEDSDCWAVPISTYGWLARFCSTFGLLHDSLNMEQEMMTQEQTVVHSKTSDAAKYSRPCMPACLQACLHCLHVHAGDSTKLHYRVEHLTLRLKKLHQIKAKSRLLITEIHKILS